MTSYRWFITPYKRRKELECTKSSRLGNYKQRGHMKAATIYNI
jgi:hypothetical protein